MTFPARPRTALAVLLACLVGVPALRAAGPPRLPPRQTQGFRRILYAAKLKPLKEIADLARDPKDTLLIIFGDLRVLDDLEEEDKLTFRGAIGLKGFLERGGAVLVASDRAGSQGSKLYSALKVSPVSGVVGNFNAGQNYLRLKERGLVVPFPHWCPFAVPDPERKNHLLFHEVEYGLATNLPTVLKNNSQDLHPLAVFPEDARFWAGRDRPGSWQESGPIPDGEPFMVGNDAPEGKTLVLGGHGVFMNDMMLNPDNCMFARNCIHWLTKRPGGGKRKHALFVEEDKVFTSFNVPLTEIPAPPLPPVEKLNRRLRQLEEENFFNKILLRVLGPKDIDDPDLRMQRARERLVMWVILAATGLLILYGFRRLRRARHRPELTVPLVAAGVAQSVSPDPLVVQRHKNMLQDDNLWEAARDLARQCFAGYVERFGTHAPRKPQVVFKGKRGRAALESLVSKLWDLAYGGPSRPITQVQFHALVAETDEVKAALAAGVLTLREPAKAGASPSVISNQ
jgi:hypothetical protein